LEPPAPPALLGALLRIPLDVIQRRIIEALHTHGFNDLVPAHLAVLRYPGPHGRRPVELAAEANMTRQAMNYLLGQLETLGYLERRPDPADLRSKRIYMTDRGEATRTVIRGAVSEVEAEWAQELGAADLEQLRALLARLAATLQRDGSGRTYRGNATTR
jgi:DNA-binding MarR family transcriptional regulator